MLLWSIALLAAISGCSDNNLSNLQLNGDTWITTFELDRYAGVIDRTNKTIQHRCHDRYRHRSVGRGRCFGQGG